MPFFDPFDLAEEEDFLKTEKEDSEHQVQEWKNKILKLGPKWEHKNENETTQRFTMVIPILPQSLSSLVDCFRTSNIKQISLTHWGLGDYGIQLLEPLFVCNNLTPSNEVQTVPTMTPLTDLQLTDCGITANGFHRLFGLLVHSKVKSLDISRNNLFRQQVSSTSHQSMEDSFSLIHETLTKRLPQCTSLRSLAMSATGMYKVRYLESVWKGVISCHQQVDSNGECLHSLLNLDASQNVGDLVSVLKSLIPYLSTMTHLQELHLVKGASSAACLDIESLSSSPSISSSTEEVGGTNLENDLLYYLLQEIPPRLHKLSLSLLPLERQANESIQRRHRMCQRSLLKILFRLCQNKCRHLSSKTDNGIRKYSSRRKSWATIFVALLAEQSSFQKCHKNEAEDYDEDAEDDEDEDLMMVSQNETKSFLSVLMEEENEKYQSIKHSLMFWILRHQLVAE